MEGNRERRPSSSPNRSPSSPFPFGSPITFSDRSLLSPLRRVSGDTLVPSQRSSSLSSSQSQHVFRGKVRAQEVYGGKLDNKKRKLTNLYVFGCKMVYFKALCCLEAHLL